MPQMEFADYAPQIVWLVITFAVFYFLMARFAIPGVERVLTAREDRIQGDLNRAQALGQQAEAAQKAFEKVSAESRATAQRLSAEARASAQAAQATRMAAVEAQLMDRLRKADEDVARARASAMQGLGTMATDIAQAAAEKLTGAKVAREAAAKAVDNEMSGKDAG